MPDAQDGVQAKDNIPLATKRNSGRRKKHFPDGTFHSEDGANLTPEEIDFGKALEYYKRKYRRPFMTSSEVLRVARCMGYRLTAPAMEI